MRNVERPYPYLADGQQHYRSVLMFDFAACFVPPSALLATEVFAASGQYGVSQR